jgi:hypothetical protein
VPCIPSWYWCLASFSVSSMAAALYHSSPPLCLVGKGPLKTGPGYDPRYLIIADGKEANKLAPLAESPKITPMWRKNAKTYLSGSGSMGCQHPQNPVPEALSVTVRLAQEGSTPAPQPGVWWGVLPYS